MKLNTYKNYRTCPNCGKELPLTREYFKRLNTPQGEIGYHHVCKKCEDNIKRNMEWRDGKLLCHCCGEYKNVSEFSPNGGANFVRNNRRSMCKECTTQRQRNHLINLENDTKLKKCLNSRLLGAKDRAKAHSIPLDITLDYLLDLWKEQNGLCALSGIKMTYELKAGRTPTNLSLDKIDREKGYVKGNVQLVCMACNQIKSDLSDKDMYYFCKKIVEHYENKNKKAAA